MATTTSISTTYAGQFSGKYVAAALLSAPTLDKEYVTIKPNIKYKDVISRIHGGGARDRKKKLLEKQKKGKARMRQFGSVDIPQEAFIEVLKINKNE